LTTQRDRSRTAGRCPVTRKRALLDRADRLLIEAMGEPDPRERLRAGYLAALRGAGAVLALTSASVPTRAKSRSAWVLMARAAPEFVMWSDYFAGFSATRAALEAGIQREVAPAEADEFCSRVAAFLHDVEDLIGDESRLRPMGSADKSA
jgi:SAV_6107-like HEPN